MSEHQPVTPAMLIAAAVRAVVTIGSVATFIAFVGVITGAAP